MSRGRAFDNRTALTAAVEDLLRRFDPLNKPDAAASPTRSGASGEEIIDPTYTVVAVDAPAWMKVRSPNVYLCDGVDDQVEIMAAQGTGRVKIQLTQGTYAIDDQLLIDQSYVWLEGAGKGVTILSGANWSGSGDFIYASGYQFRISNLTIFKQGT